MVWGGHGQPWQFSWAQVGYVLFRGYPFLNFLWALLKANQKKKRNFLGRALEDTTEHRPVPLAGRPSRVDRKNLRHGRRSSALRLDAAAGSADHVLHPGLLPPAELAVAPAASSGHKRAEAHVRVSKLEWWFKTAGSV